ncbi:sphingomyelin phosphodiesterase 4-like isoform X1 [Asterias rubens]|uniref:sphingomyelin phosphodiesterase 4-like isoform X1 n=1 Tax=Asterias rubens TaxID=7604 RepID=UPI001455A7F7|nr:sphingomyelin phosphodiesterase 4-like isoform X1 [Asterias rubens]
MAASLFGATLGISPGSMSITLSSRSSGILDTFNKPLRQRCEEIADFIHKLSSKELHVVYQPLLENIFGYNQNFGWGLQTVSQQSSREDFHIIKEFLAPRGPLMTMVYKLQVDGIFRYEFPVSCLPAPTRDALLDGAMPGFYLNKLSYQTQGRPPVSVLLNAFEYFMYSFAYLIIFRHKQQSQQQWVESEDWLYPRLLSDYLHYFLPIDGTSLPLTPFTSSTQVSSHQGHSPSYRVPQYGVLYQYLYSSELQHNQLFRSEVTGSKHRQPLLNLNQSSQMESGSRETWRSEILLQALGELWLNQNMLQSKQGFRQHVRENYIPSSDHVRVVRILVKHLHFFVNSARPPLSLSAYQHPEQDQLEEFKRYVIPQFIKKKLYVFLRHGFDNWPLDSTFRQMLEVWLSYIQPWRYVDQSGETERSPRGPMRETQKDKPIQEERWLKFISSNLMFYTVLFQEFLPRAFRQDLTSPKNAIVLFRVAKVLAQSNLAMVLQEAERSLYEDYGSPHHGHSASYGSSFLTPKPNPSVPDLGSQVAELETPGFMYTLLYSNDVKALIERLLQNVHQAQITVSNLSYTPVTNDGEGFLSWFSQSTFSDPRSQRLQGHLQLQDDIGPVDTNKLCRYLEYTKDYLSKVFQVNAPSLLEESINGGSNGSTAINENGQPPHCVNGQLSPKGRFQMMNKLRKFEIAYRGDPELQPIRSFENAYLVRKLYALSSNFNTTFGDKVSEVYRRADFSGALAKQIFTAPPSIPTHRQTAIPTPPYRASPQQQTCNPRLSLRFLANYYTLAKLVLLSLILWLFIGFGPTGILLTLVFLTVLYIFFSGVVYTVRQHSHTHEHIE